ncbi:MAG: hypothetical protein ACXVAX_04205 [Pseudobdellovibrio sp.]
MLGPSYDTSSPAVSGSSYGTDRVGPGYGVDAGYAFRLLPNLVIPLTLGGYIYQEGTVLSPQGNGGANRATNLKGKFELAAGVGFLYLIGFETGAYALGVDYSTFRGIGLSLGLYY